jgi:murein DD-endopeptidase MepM/ murein hydrolase activator NlpD
VPRRPSRATHCLLLSAVLTLVPPGALFAQHSVRGYRYRDANGQWVYADRAASTAAPADPIALGHESGAVHISLERRDSSDATQLIAISNCLCVVTLRVSIEQSELPQILAGATYQATLEPKAHQTLVSAPRGASGTQLRFTWSAALGSPAAVHSPPHPYRAPFAIGATYLVAQAYPVQITHVTPDSRYAIDFALPDATPVYAARAGTVINVRHDSFTGAPLPVMLDQANLVEILHDDGTIAVYAHLHWDSIRVRIGAHVSAGEYIANSGDTGFSTGPHLHFAVWRNAGGTDVSVPVEFAGPGGAAVTATTAMPLTAY